MPLRQLHVWLMPLWQLYIRQLYVWLLPLRQLWLLPLWHLPIRLLLLVWLRLLLMLLLLLLRSLRLLRLATKPKAKSRLLLLLLLEWVLLLLPHVRLGQRRGARRRRRRRRRWRIRRWPRLEHVQWQRASALQPARHRADGRWQAVAADSDERRAASAPCIAARGRFTRAALLGPFARLVGVRIVADAARSAGEGAKRAAWGGLVGGGGEVGAAE